MGIDTIFLVRANEPLSDAALAALRYDVGQSFGYCHFFVSRNIGITSFDWHIVDRTSDPLIYGVRLTTRYYGPEYERGDVVLILALRRWFAGRGYKVYYGGDSTYGYPVEGEDLDECIPPEFTAEEAEALWRHFSEFGHEPYSWQRHDTIPSPTCNICKHEMSCQMWGGPNKGRAGFECHGCGWYVETDDGGKSFGPVAQKT